MLKQQSKPIYLLIPSTDSLAQRLPAIHPGGMFKWTLGVTSIPGNSTTAAMPSFNITITPQECDHDLPLISIAFSQVGLGQC